MKYTLTAHAKKRMAERVITEKLLNNALQNPTKIAYNNRGQILLKKLYQREKKEWLLLIVGEENANELKIITIIDTSKIKKYL